MENTIEKILMELMTAKCHSVVDSTKKCYAKGKCDGSCAAFFKAKMDLEEVQR